MPISITIDPATLAQVESDLAGIPNGLNRAASAAANDAASRGKGKYVDAAAEITTAKKKFIRSRVSGARKATPSNPASEIKVSGTPLKLTRFKIKGGKRRQLLTAELIRGRTQSYPGAFLGTGPKGGATVLTRKGGKRFTTAAHYLPNLYRRREPVKSQPAISIRELFDMRPEAERKAEQQTAEIFATRLLSQVDRLLERKRSARS